MAVYNSKLAEDFDIPGKCSFCGSDSPQSFWRGGENVRTCRGCAVDILPKLLADSIVLDRKSPALENSVDLFFEKAKANYYEACFKSLLRADNEK